MEPIIVEQTYLYSIELVLEALTDPAALAEWLMPGDFKPVVGHLVQFHCEPRPEYDGTIHVEVLEVDKPRKLSYSWKTNNMDKPSLVTFFLKPMSNGGTHLRMEHTGLEGDSGAIMYPLFKGGWAHKLGQQFPQTLAQLSRRKKN
jgi:uncharacterized protein YndB with AHSA1/START domain